MSHVQRNSGHPRDGTSAEQQRGTAIWAPNPALRNRGHAASPPGVRCHGGGAIRLVPEPTAQAARAAIRGGQAYAAILSGRHGESLVIETAASPGTAAVLTKGFTTAAAAMKIPLQVRDDGANPGPADRSLSPAGPLCRLCA